MSFVKNACWPCSVTKDIVYHITLLAPRAAHHHMVSWLRDGSMSACSAYLCSVTHPSDCRNVLYIFNSRRFRIIHESSQLSDIIRISFPSSTSYSCVGCPELGSPRDHFHFKLPHRRDQHTSNPGHFLPLLLLLWFLAIIRSLRKQVSLVTENTQYLDSY